MKFIGREEEISQINKALSSNHLECIVVYGRRHIGKTELIKHCAMNDTGESFYYMCREIREKQQIDGLTQVLSGNVDLGGTYYRSFEDILRYFFVRGEKKKTVLILDEYPNPRKMIQGLDSILQALIDEYKHTSNLKLILSGSYIDIMKSIKESNSPLFGRITMTIDLKQMNYYDASKFYPSFSDEDKVMLYSVFGGMPLYNSLINKEISAKENIINLVASKNARLQDEIDFFLRTELSKLDNANSVFDALASGNNKYNQILETSDIKSTASLRDILVKLCDMEVIKKEYPINKENDKSKSKYYINDNLALFYFKYIAKNSSQLEIMNPKVFYDKYIEKDLHEHFIPKAFENICKEYLIKENKAGRIDPVITKIGKYYYDDAVEHKNGEFDIVSEDDNGYIFYEAKYKNQPITEGIIQKEIEQVNKTNLKSYKYGFFSKSGYTKDVNKEVIKYTLKDLYK